MNSQMRISQETLVYFGVSPDAPDAVKHRNNRGSLPCQPFVKGQAGPRIMNHLSAPSTSYRIGHLGLHRMLIGPKMDEMDPAAPQGQFPMTADQCASERDWTDLQPITAIRRVTHHVWWYGPGSGLHRALCIDCQPSPQQTVTGLLWGADCSALLCS